MRSSVLLRFFDYVFVLRPLILIPAWSFYLIGAAAANGSVSAGATGLPGPMAFLSLTAILITAYLLNQVFDRESDEKNDKCFYLARGIFHERTLVLLAAVFFVAASITFRRAGVSQRLPLVLALLLSLVYSLPPIRLCARPFFDLIANAAGYGGIAFVLGYIAEARTTGFGTAAIAAVPYVLLVASTFIHTTMLDVEGDRAAGKISTAVFLGERVSSFVAGAFHLAAVVAAVVTGDVLAVVVTLVALPASVLAFFRRTRNASAFLVQTSTLVVTVAAAIMYPVYLALVAPLLLLSRFYYKKRFGITYPGLQRDA
jgi:4-hydroxybenzoate polyprenyltransferase